ncbi:hypothetical protein EG68_09591 [Paragonimus skrjabini miyazakii]|uniref:Eukaryotic translation initiation factor 4E transporter n=1 Tax=Paragonimus skrjabini miyazakii TaxID=59628 RepID=A0A8S9YH27_9TREM|nr:hypothetical protein EG68_09591 [Paragonimus skrjabini miyazakii]
MDAVAKPSEIANEPSRLRYERDVILAIKKHVTESGIELSNVFNLSPTISRNVLAKPKRIVFPKAQNDRPRDSGSIVLGPQKRPWNTGCHVTYSGRETGDGASRGSKHGTDYRSVDKAYFGYPNDYKRYHRGSGRDRGGRRTDGSVFSRIHRDDRHWDNKQARSCEEEPEWFSEGPATVSDTIELGRVIEDVDECTAFGPRMLEMSVSSTRDNLEPRQKKSEAEQTMSPKSSIEKQNCSKSIEPAAAVDIDSTKNTELPGSRFKHLFPQLDVSNDSAKTIDAMNDQLMQLLKGSVSRTNINSPDKNNVLQVENKLRSILLGHDLRASNESNRPKMTETKSTIQLLHLRISGTKPQILTVEEIEAQLSLPTHNSSPVNPPVVASTKDFQSTLSVDNKLMDSLPLKAQSTNQPNSRFSNSPNLTSILQSLALNQQSVCSKPVQLHGPFGILSSPIARLPTTTNAVSASARINQLQHCDPSASSGLSDVTQQGGLRQVWDALPDSRESNSPRLMPHSADMSSMMLQHSVGFPTGSLSEMHSRPMLMSNSNSLAPPRRPIVKAQQGLSGNHPSPFLSSLGLAAPNTPPHNLNVSLQDFDRRLLNLALKQQHQQRMNYGGPPNVVSKLPGNLFSPVGGDLCYVGASSVPQLPTPLAPIASSNNNNADCFTSRTRTAALQSDSSLAFLSHLVEMDRSSVSCGYPKSASASVSPLLNVAVKAKTLEEIEHQEVANGGTF